MSRIRFTSLLLCSTAIISTPVMADASLDELKAKLEQAQKENLILKTEKIERENVTMKLEQIQAENAALRNEMKVDKTPTASIPAQKTASAPSNTQEVKTVARREPVEASVLTPREHVTARKEINHALDNIPKDDARREMTAAYKAPREEVPVVVKQWQGIYGGIVAGYGANDINIYSTTIGFAPGSLSYNTTSPEPIIGGSSTAQYFSGPVVGGVVGYNHEFSNHIIIGAETDMAWSDINNNSITGTKNWTYVMTPSVRQVNSTNNRTGLDWVGTARVRLGYSLGKFMPYVTGGLAYGYLSASGNNSNTFGYGFSGGYSSSFGNSGGTNYSSVNIGWSAGAGAEYMVADSWSVKGEYLFTQLAGINGATYGSSSAGYNCSGCSPTLSALSSGPILTQSTMGAFGIHQARVGLNYHTGWLGGGTPAVTAKY